MSNNETAPRDESSPKEPKLLANIDMAKVWKQYAEQVEKHLEKNRRARVKSMDPKQATYYG